MPILHLVQTVDVFTYSVPGPQNEQFTPAPVFSSWYLPGGHTAQPARVFVNSEPDAQYLQW